MKVYKYDEEEHKMELYGEIIENTKIKYILKYEKHLMYNEVGKEGKIKMFNTWIDVVLHLQREPATLVLDKCDWGDIKLKAMNELAQINLSVYQEALEAFKLTNNTNVA